MKRCPQCNSVYSNNDLVFCLTDGAALIQAEAAPTVAFSSNQPSPAPVVPKSLKGPAIGLISSGILNIIWSIVFLLSNSIEFLKQENQNLKSDGEQIAGTTGYVLGSGFLVLGLAVAPIVIYAALQMLKGERYRLAKTAGILSVIPCTSCCFFVGVPIGIWTLVVLADPEVKAFFQSRENQR